MEDNLYIEFVASQSLYEEDGVLHGTGQVDHLIVGPIACFHMVFHTIRILSADYDERHIGALAEDDGLWHIGMSMEPVEGTVAVTPKVSANSLVFTDMNVTTDKPSADSNVRALTDFPED